MAPELDTLVAADATVVHKELDALPVLFPADKEDRNWIRYAADIGNHVDEFAGCGWSSID